MSMLAEETRLNWHASNWQFIETAIQNNHLPTALLLEGGPHLGKGVFAKQLAKRLLCHKSYLGKACNQCQSCLQFNSQNHPDFYYLAPEEKNKSLGIDDIRLLSERIQKSSHQQGYKVAIIDPMSSLTLAASHAFLKTLEEPLGNVVILATLSKPNQILQTLRSRMVALPFYANEENNLSFNSKGLQDLFSQCPLIEQSINIQSYIPLFEAVLNHIGKALVPKISVLDYPKEWKDQVDMILKILFLLVKDIIFLKQSIPLAYCVYEAYPKKIEYVANKLTLSATYELAQDIGQALADLQSLTAFNAEYLLGKLLIRFQSYSI